MSKRFTVACMRRHYLLSLVNTISCAVNYLLPFAYMTCCPVTHYQLPFFIRPISFYCNQLQLNWSNALFRLPSPVIRFLRLLPVTHQIHIHMRPYLALTYVTFFYLILSYLILSYLTLPYLRLPTLTLSYLTLPYVARNRACPLRSRS